MLHSLGLSYNSDQSCSCCDTTLLTHRVAMIHSSSCSRSYHSLLGPATALSPNQLHCHHRRSDHGATTGAPITAVPCAPAWCGDLAICYPFWVPGTQPKCGHQGFHVTCDKAKAYLKNSVWTYQIEAIFYTTNLLRVANVDLSLDGTTCNINKFVNASSVLRQFYIDSKNDMELFFYGCNLRASQLPRSWAPLSCDNGWFTWLSGQYRPDDSSMALPGNCNVAMIPVLADEGATGADYQRLMEGFCLVTSMRTRTNAAWARTHCSVC